MNDVMNVEIRGRLMSAEARTLHRDLTPEIAADGCRLWYAEGIFCSFGAFLAASEC